MDLLKELARTDIDPALLAQVQTLFAQQQAKRAEKDCKITALTPELPYYRRIRFGKTRSNNAVLCLATASGHHRRR